MYRNLNDVFMLGIGLIAILSLSLFAILYERPLEDCDLSSGFVQYKNCIIPVTELLRTPELYHGKLVYVSGTFSFEVEDNFISSSEDDAGKIEADFSLEELEKRNWGGRSKGVLRGIFDKTPSGYQGYFSGSLNDVVIVKEDADQSR